MMEYSIKAIRRNKDDSIRKEHNSLKPVEVLYDSKIPETFDHAVARVLRASGQLTQDQYFALNGLHYDGDYEDDDDLDYDVDDYDDDLVHFHSKYYEKESLKLDAETASLTKVDAKDNSTVPHQPEIDPVSISNTKSESDASQNG